MTRCCLESPFLYARTWYTVHINASPREGGEVKTDGIRKRNCRMRERKPARFPCSVNERHAVLLAARMDDSPDSVSACIVSRARSLSHPNLCLTFHYTCCLESDSSVIPLDVTIHGTRFVTAYTLPGLTKLIKTCTDRKPTL